jgi:hypothetical protein
VIRHAALVIAVCSATVAACSAIWGIWDAAATWAVCAAVHLTIAAWLDHSHRSRERMRRYRNEVWERRQRYTLDDLFEMQERACAERGHTTTVVYDPHGEPVAGHDSRGNNAAIWPTEAGAPE